MGQHARLVPVGEQLRQHQTKKKRDAEEGGGGRPGPDADRDDIDVQLDVDQDPRSPGKVPLKIVVQEKSSALLEDPAARTTRVWFKLAFTPPVLPVDTFFRQQSGPGCV
jgi:hypothetical protein